MFASSFSKLSLAFGLAAVGSLARAEVVDDLYVQNGLVAHWDAIDNVGAGQHDASATIWKDVKGGYEWDFGQTGIQMNETHLYFNGNAFATMQGAGPFKGAKTVEILCSFDSLSKMQILLHPQKDTTTVAFGFEDSTTHGVVISTYKSAVHGFPAPSAGADVLYSFTYGSDANNPNAYYCNGQASGTTGGDSWGNPDATLSYLGKRKAANSYPFKGKVYAIRVYSRALTADEVAHNYEVDQARFLNATKPLTVCGSPVNAVDSDDKPDYGTTEEAPGQEVTLTAPAKAAADGVDYDCEGCDVAWFDSTGAAHAVETTGDGNNSVTFTMPSAPTRLTWLWGHGDLELSAELVQSGSTDVKISGVAQNCGLGADATADLYLTLRATDGAEPAPALIASGLKRGTAWEYALEDLEPMREYAWSVALVAADKSSDPIGGTFVTVSKYDPAGVSTAYYRQDGLLACWDGVENAGAGVHDASATAWTDVKNGSAWAFTGSGITIGADYIGFDGTGNGYGKLLKNDADGVFVPKSSRTIEIVASFEGTGNQILFHSQSGADLGFGRYNQDILTTGGATARASFKVFDTIAEANHYSVTYDGNVPQSLFLNGETAILGGNNCWGSHSTDAYLGKRWPSGPTVSANPFKGKIHAIRVYDSKLSQAEIAGNLAVDRMRFFGEGYAFEVAGSPVNAGEVEPAYGAYAGVALGTKHVCTAPTSAGEYVCAGYRICRVNPDGSFSTLREGEGTSVTFYQPNVPVRLVWQWLADQPSIEAKVGETGLAYARFSGTVTSCGSGAEAVDIYLSVGPKDGGRGEPVKVAENVAKDETWAHELIGLDPAAEYGWTVEARSAISSCEVSGTLTTASPGTELTDRPIVALDSLTVNRDLSVGFDFNAVWAGAKDARVDVFAVFSNRTSSVVREFRIAESAIGTGSGVVEGLEVGESYEVALVAKNGASVSEPTAGRTVQMPGPVVLGKVTAGLSQNNLTVEGRLADPGLGTTTVRLVWWSDTETNEIEVVTFDETSPQTYFSKICKVPFGEEFRWKVVASNVVDERIWTAETAASAPLRAQDDCQYAWRKNVKTGKWADRGNWDSWKSADECRGYPNDSKANAYFWNAGDSIVDLEGGTYEAKSMEVRADVPLTLLNGRVSATSLDVAQANSLIGLDSASLTCGSAPAGSCPFLSESQSGLTLEFRGEKPKFIYTGVANGVAASVAENSALISYVLPEQPYAEAPFQMRPWAAATVTGLANIRFAVASGSFPGGEGRFDVPLMTFRSANDPSDGLAAALEAINARCVFDKRLQGSKIVAKVTEDETHAENPHVTTLWLRIRRGLTVIVK